MTARPQLKITIELYVEPAEPEDTDALTYGKLVGLFVDLPGALVVSFDSRAQASASGSMLTVIIYDDDDRTKLEIAGLYGCDSWSSFVELIGPDDVALTDD